MKKLSFLLALLLTVVLLSHNSSAQLNNCRDALSRLDACTGGSCCAEVDDVVEYCPRHLRGPFRWLMKAYERCNNVENNPVTPPPPTPPPNPVCSLLTMPRSCGQQMNAFGLDHSISAISADCCKVITNLQLESCHLTRWSDFIIRCQDYCRNHH